MGAVVIVSTLEQLARDAIQSSGCLLFHTESTKQHSVFFFQRPEIVQDKLEPPDVMEPYLRARRKFSSGSLDYELETAYNLPDFDTIGYAVELAQEVLSPDLISGDVLFWNPGQGHLPVFAERRRARGFTRVRLAGRDALELAMTARNLAKAGREAVQALLLPTEAGLAEAFEAGSFDLLCALLRPVPKAPWHIDLARSAETLLRKGGVLLAAGASTEVFRVLEKCRGFKTMESIKRLGHRAVLLKRR